MRDYTRWEGAGQSDWNDDYVDLFLIRKKFRQRGVWMVFAGINYFDGQPIPVIPKPFGTYGWKLVCKEKDFKVYTSSVMHYRKEWHVRKPL